MTGATLTPPAEPLGTGATLTPPAEPLATGATLTPSADSLATPGDSDPRPTYRCPECEHVLRVSGLGRHRVYFELADERSQDPVMNRVCPACGHGLPGKNAP